MTRIGIPRPRFIIAVGAAVAAVILLTSPLLVGGIPYHLACQQGSQAFNTALWTPIVISNSPFGGTANATGAMLAAGLPVPGLGGTVSATNGSTEGLFALMPWSVFSLSSGWVLGLGQNQPCSSHYDAVQDFTPILLPSGAFTASFELAPPGSMSTQGIPDSFFSAGASSVIFNPNFQNATGGLATCQGGGATQYLSLSAVLVAISGHGLTVPAIVPDVTVYTYRFPGSFGAWATDQSASAGLAFQYSTCT